MQAEQYQYTLRKILAKQSNGMNLGNMEMQVLRLLKTIAQQRQAPASADPNEVVITKTVKEYNPYA